MKIERAPLPDGATLVETIPFVLTHRLLRDILPARKCLEVSGQPGTGKTFCVDDFFEGSDCEVVKIHLEGVVRGYGFLRRLVRELGGDPSGDSENLMKALRTAIGTRRLYVYVDEADNLNLDSLRQIRFLRDQRDIGIAFILVGSSFKRAYRLVPELWSRVTWRTCFDPLEGAALHTALAAYHPFLGIEDTALIDRIDEQHCRGLWRVWSETLSTLLDYADRLHVEQLTAQLAAAVLGVSIDRQRIRRPGTKTRRPKKVR